MATTPSDPPGTVCLSSDGAVLLIERPGQTVQATSYKTTVADDAFTLPAEP